MYSNQLTTTLLSIRAKPLIGAVLSCFIAATAFSGTITRHTFHSPTLNREYAFNLYLPDGYETNTLTYPTVYLLHGSFEDESAWPQRGKAKAIFDQIIADRTIPPTVVVMPGSQSWWINGHNERAEDAFIEDLIPHVEKNWRVLPTRQGRIIGGNSAGGFGAVNLSLKHPEKFAAAAAFSPASYEDLPPDASSAYRHPCFLDSHGKFDPKIWRHTNYPSHLDAYQKQEHIVPIYINSGDRDFLDIAYHAAVLHHRLRQIQPDHLELRILPGEHDWLVWNDTLAEAMRYTFQHASAPQQ